MAQRERAALLVWTSALILVVALPFSYWRAPSDCFFSPEDFARCDPWRAIAALAEGAASVLAAAALWISRTSGSTSLHRIARVAGVAGIAFAVIGSLAAVLGDAYLVARQVAALGFAGLGLALAVESEQGDPLVRSRLGIVLGITLGAWAIAYLFRDDLILPVGGALFFLPYAVWAARLGYRLGTGHAPAPRDGRPVELTLAANAGAVLLFFLGFPFWLGSTFGVVVLGDPTNDVHITNETGEPIIFYEDRRLLAYGERIEAGETKASSWMEHGAYSPAATDLGGTKVFCRSLLDRELRRAHYRLTVTRDPASCSAP